MAHQRQKHAFTGRVSSQLIQKSLLFGMLQRPAHHRFLLHHFRQEGAWHQREGEASVLSIGVGRSPGSSESTQAPDFRLAYLQQDATLEILGSEAQDQEGNLHLTPGSTELSQQGPQEGKLIHHPDRLGSLPFRRLAQLGVFVAEYSRSE